MTKKIKLTLSLLGLVGISAATVPLVMTSCSSNNSFFSGGIVNGSVAGSYGKVSYSLDPSNTTVMTKDNLEDFAKKLLNEQSTMGATLKQAGSQVVDIDTKITIKDNIITVNTIASITNSLLGINYLTAIEEDETVYYLNEPSTTYPVIKYKVTISSKALLPSLSFIPTQSQTLYLIDSQLRTLIPGLTLN